MQLAITGRQTDLRGYSDEDLVDLARQGSENAVRALIKRNNQRLFRVARAVVRDDGEAEDIVQETYVRAFTKTRFRFAVIPGSRLGSRGLHSMKRLGGYVSASPASTSRPSTRKSSPTEARWSCSRPR